MFSAFEIGLLCVVGYICVYSLVDRICKCKEQCTMAEAYAKYLQSQGDVNQVTKAFGELMKATRKPVGKTNE